MPSKYQEYRQMADTAERQLTSSYKSWTQFLRTAARLYKYPYMKEQKYSYSQRIGKTTFIVNVKQSESAKKPLNTVFQDICKHEVLGGFFTDKSFNLENPQKVS